MILLKPDNLQKTKVLCLEHETHNITDYELYDLTTHPFVDRGVPVVPGPVNPNLHCAGHLQIADRRIETPPGIGARESPIVSIDMRRRCSTAC